MKKQPILSSLLLGCVLASASYASHIEVINKNKKPLKIKIQTEGSAKENVSYPKDISAEERSTFTVDEKDLKGRTQYAIEGQTNLFTSGDKCRRLSVEKDYVVTFLDDTLGTTCVAEETNIRRMGDSPMSEEKLKGKWDQLVGKLKESWGNLTDQDLEKVKGKKDQLIGLIQEKYGETKEKVEEKVNALLDKLND
jgi:uncharacterized protein YjbJ (UPF0337 family)